jgi:hypothetical protein
MILLFSLFLFLNQVQCIGGLAPALCLRPTTYGLPQADAATPRARLHRVRHAGFWLM